MTQAMYMHEVSSLAMHIMQSLYHVVVIISSLLFSLILFLQVVVLTEITCLVLSL